MVPVNIERYAHYRHRIDTEQQGKQQGSGSLCCPGVPSAWRLRNRCHEQGCIFLVDMHDVLLDAITVDADHVFVLQKKIPALTQIKHGK